MSLALIPSHGCATAEMYYRMGKNPKTNEQIWLRVALRPVLYLFHHRKNTFAPLSHLQPNRYHFALSSFRCVYVHDRILDYTACIGASRFAAVSFPRFLCNAHSPLGRTSMHCYVRMHGIIVCILPFSAVNTNYFCVYFIYIIYCRHAHKRFTAHFPFVVGKQYAFAQE